MIEHEKELDSENQKKNRKRKMYKMCFKKIKSVHILTLTKILVNNCVSYNTQL